MQFKPGDKVKCIDTASIQLRLGSIYTVLKWVPARRRDLNISGCVMLKETDQDVEWNSNRFVLVRPMRNLPKWF